MTWIDRMSALLARKSSRAGAAVAAVGLAPARWTPRRYDRLAEEGYRKNVVAYRCVREVARACASVPWLLYRGTRELDQHPLLDLLRRPNPRQSGPELVEAAIGHLLLSGNAYLEVVRPDGEAPRELYALRPDRLRIVPDVSGVPRAYRYEVEGRSVDWPVDPISGASDVLHLRDFHPLDDWYGLSPIEAAASSIDQHNAAAEHNAALLQNGARPSGALVFRADPGPDGIRRVEEALLDRTQGPRQAGRPLVLGGDVDWKELGFSPKDMDFAELKSQAAREIAAAFGVPHLLVVSGEATYSNRTDARLELWEHTVIPLLDRLASALSSWLEPLFGENLRLAHDLDEVPALAPRRRLKWQQIQQADFLTLNEKRQALGYAPVADGDGEGEQKNSEEFRRLHGYEQPRNPAGGQDGGRWSRSPESFVSLLQGRVIQSPGTRRPPVGRPGAGSGGQRGGGGGIPPRLPPRNPFPDKPECNEQWRRAVEDCKAEDDRMAAQPWSARSSRLFGYDYLDCLEIRISEECGGKPIGKKAMTGLKGACEMSSHPTSDRDPPLIKRAKDLSSAGDYEGAIESYTLHLTQFPEDASAFRWRAFALQQTERFAEAIVDLERSLCIAPGFPPAVFHRAEALAALGYYDEALDEFDRLEVAVPGYNTQTIAMFRAHCLIELGRYEEALANIRRLPDGRGIVGRERAALMERLPVDRRDAR